ncbi:MAG: RimK family alpha-L-glutamate ligase [Candidatus Nanohaloarchaea archaeon]
MTGFIGWLYRWFVDGGNDIVIDEEFVAGGGLEDRETPEIMDSDLLLAADRQLSLSPVIDELEDRGYSVHQFNSDDIEYQDNEAYIDGVSASLLEDKTVLHRNKRGFEDHAGELEELAEHGLDFINTPEGSDISNDKNRTKKALKRHGVQTPETYTTEEEVETALEEGPVIKKPDDQSRGREVEVLRPEEDLEFDTDKIYEECIDHWNTGVEERRAVVFAGSHENRIIETKTREGEEYEPKNIANGGAYRDPDELYLEEFETLWDSADALGGGLLGIDYTVTPDGETTVLEVNSTVGLDGIRSASDQDIDSEIADMVEKELEPSGYHRRTYSGHLEERLETGRYLEPETPETPETLGNDTETSAPV